jgi:hypothetical protein
MTDIENSFVHEDIEFEIIGDHPHAGEKCHPIGADKDHIHYIQINPNSDVMYEVSLIDCPVGVEGAYVAKKNLRLTRKPIQKMKVEIKHFKALQ